MTRRETIKTLLNLLLERGPGHRLGDGNTALDNALRCAAMARQASATPELTSAALLHRIGQLLDDKEKQRCGAGPGERPEWTGARFLARWFPPAVTDPVRLHVAARRYLCTTSPAYLERLPGAVRDRVAASGGPMARDEMVAFKSEPFFADALELRRWDDRAERSDLGTPPLTDFASELLKAWRPALAEHS